MSKNNLVLDYYKTPWKEPNFNAYFHKISYVAGASTKPTLQSSQKNKTREDKAEYVEDAAVPRALVSTIDQDTAILTGVFYFHPDPPDIKTKRLRSLPIPF
jgi:hypothetical protein